MIDHTTCGHCGRPLAGHDRHAIHFGDLEVDRDPLQVRWRGQPIALSPTEGRILELVASQGYARWEELESVVEGHGAGRGSLGVLLHRIRRKFVAAGAFEPFVTVRKWGIRFNTPPGYDSPGKVHVAAASRHDLPVRDGRTMEPLQYLLAHSPVHRVTPRADDYFVLSPLESTPAARRLFQTIVHSARDHVGAGYEIRVEHLHREPTIALIDEVIIKRI